MRDSPERSVAGRAIHIRFESPESTLRAKEEGQTSIRRSPKLKDSNFAG